jgi:hypothetical protein
LKALVALVAAIGCLAAVAYGAMRPASGSSPSSKRSHLHARGRPPKPRITRHPTRTTLSTNASFRLADRQSEVGFECKLDGAKWHRCESRVGYSDLAVGIHVFYARARGGARTSRPVRFTWKQAQPVGFSIEQQPGLGPLYPGAPAQPIPVRLTNPNPGPIFVTGLWVSVPIDPAGCASAAHLELTPSTASAAAPIEVPAGSSISLPAQGTAPMIAMRDLSVSQDACQNAQFPLVFSGDAYG